MVGRTHEDIDQMFSCVSRLLIKSSANTLDDPRTLVERSNNPQPKTIKIERAFDIKPWLEKHMHGLEEHSRPHQFKFEKDCGGYVKMHYRKLSTSEWKSAEKRILHTIPSDVPNT